MVDALVPVDVDRFAALEVRFVGAFEMLLAVHVSALVAAATAVVLVVVVPAALPCSACFPRLLFSLTLAAEQMEPVVSVAADWIGGAAAAVAAVE